MSTSLNAQRGMALLASLVFMLLLSLSGLSSMVSATRQEKLAAGIQHAFLVTGSAFAWSTKTLRAAMGANFHLNIVEHCTLDMLAPRLAVPLLATSSHAQAAVFDTDLRAAVGWVVGNEGAGVSPEWMAKVSRTVGIPQPGGLESLNVAAATAICLFEAVRQRRPG